MKILTPSDLFNIYDFDDEVKIQINQFYNADKSIIPQINGLCLKAKVAKINDESLTLLHTNCYLLKMGTWRLVFTKNDEKVFFISISIIKEH